jgi:hypothetical protein
MKTSEHPAARLLASISNPGGWSQAPLGNGEPAARSEEGER